MFARATTAALFCLFLLSVAATAAVIHVPADQPTIQAGIDASASGDTVLVAPGTYTGANNTNIMFNGRQITLESETGAAACIIDCQGSVDPGMQILNTGVVVRGLTFTGSNVDGVVVYSTTTLEDCVISGHGECGIDVGYGNLTLSGCTVNDNGQSGVRAVDYGEITITGCTLSGNTAEGYLGESASISGCIITLNMDCGIKLLEGGSVTDSYIAGNYAVNAHGGGISSRGTVRVSNCEIIGNVAVTGTGWGEGGGIWYAYGSPVITDCTISGNGAGLRGGAIATSENHLVMKGRSRTAGPARAATISGNLITGNNSSGPGGAIYCGNSGQMNLDNNLIAGNSGSTAAVVNDIWSSTMTIRNCTIAGNVATGTGQSVGGVLSSSEDLIIENTILWGNVSDGGNQAGIISATLAISHSDVEDGQAGIEVTGGTLDWGTGMIELDPFFVVGPDHDYYLGQLAAGQLVDSPCLDTGSDLAGAICYAVTGGGNACLDTMTTRSDHGWNDTGQADMGYHHALYPGVETVSTDLACLPAAGTLPFDVQMWVALDNLYTGQVRRLAARLDVLLASGQSISNWRSGYTNVGPGATYTATWNQGLPAYGSLVGENRFTLRCWDVTPAPYNQPPYPPAGDSSSDSCTVTAAAS